MELLLSIHDAALNILGVVSDFVWGLPIIVLIVGTGLFLTIRLRGIQFRKLIYAHKLIFTKDESSPGDISHFQALTTALAATIGTGNIAGVSTAIVSGGPGAVFWMWVTGLVGMATKYSEAILAVKYRQVDEKGEMSGGPMYYIEKGLGLKWLAVLFAIFGAIAAFGIGNMVQSNSVADSVRATFGIAPWITGLALVAFTALVVIGGIKSIGRVTAYFIPIMAAFYVAAGLIILAINYAAVPAAFAAIFKYAFTPHAAVGGAIGSAIRFGVARGIFSNESGLGSAPIAAAAAKTDYPGRQALVSMTQTFIDTLVVCSITALAILTTFPEFTDIQALGISGAALTTHAFATTLPTGGAVLVAISIMLFAYSTILGWCYYGEKCMEYLFGIKTVKWYRYVFVAMIFVGAVAQLDLVWDFSDVANALMAAPNLIGLIGLSGVVVAETNRFLNRHELEK